MRNLYNNIVSWNPKSIKRFHFLLNKLLAISISIIGSVKKTARSTICPELAKLRFVVLKINALEGENPFII